MEQRKKKNKQDVVNTGISGAKRSRGAKLDAAEPAKNKEAAGKQRLAAARTQHAKGQAVSSIAKNHGAWCAARQSLRHPRKLSDLKATGSSGTTALRVVTNQQTH